MRRDKIQLEDSPKGLIKISPIRVKIERRLYRRLEKMTRKVKTTWTS